MARVAQKIKETEEKKPFPKWLAALLVVLLLLGAGAGAWFYQQSLQSDVQAYGCNLESNSLFDSVYPRYSAVQNASEWMQVGQGDYHERVQSVIDRMARSQGIATQAAGQYFVNHPPNISFVSSLNNGAAAMQTVRQDANSPVELRISTALMEKNDDAEVALSLGHEAIHHVEADLVVERHDDICSEMRAEAYAVLMYLEFKEKKYDHPSMEAEVKVLRDQSNWQWDSRPWAEDLAPKWGIELPK